MSAALWVGLLATPVAAGVVLVVPPRVVARGFTPRVFALLGLSVACAGFAVALAGAVHRPVGSHGFALDAWRGGLALAATLVALASCARRPSVSPVGQAAFLATVGAGVGAILAGGIFPFALLLVVTTAGFAVTALARDARNALRAIPYLGASDVLAIAGLALAAGDGMGVPPVAHGAGGALLLAGAAVRAGLLPGSAWFEDAAEDDPGIALGVLRAQAIAMAGWVAIARSDAATVMAVGAGLLAAWSAWRCARESSPIAASTALTALILTGLGLGGAAATQGAILLAAGMFAGSTALAVGMTRGAAAPSLGAGPLGAALPGAALVVSAAFARALGDRPMLAAAVPAGAALVWLARSAVAGWRPSPGLRARASWSVIPAAAVAALVFVPGLVLGSVGPSASIALGVARTVVPVTPAIPNELAVAFVLAAIGVVAAKIESARDGGARAEPAEVVLGEGPPFEVSPLALRVMLVIGTLAGAWLVVLFVIGVRRGFL